MNYDGQDGVYEVFDPDEIEHKLFEILNDTSTENEEIFDQIEDNFTEDECQSNHFVRALITSVCRSCMPDSKIEPDLFKKRGLILSKYIARKDDLELESLFAIQALDYKLQHQPGFIRIIFDMLYDEDIISEDVFRLWQKTDREDGHAISCLSLKAFFEWLDEAEASES